LCTLQNLIVQERLEGILCKDKDHSVYIIVSLHNYVISNTITHNLHSIAPSHQYNYVYFSIYYLSSTSPKVDNAVFRLNLPPSILPREPF